MVEADLAKKLSENLKNLIECAAFKILWGQLDREIRRAEVDILTVGRDPDLTSEQVTTQLRDRQGFLRALLHVKNLPEEMIEVLSQGSIPWKE